MTETKRMMSVETCGKNSHLLEDFKQVNLSSTNEKTENNGLTFEDWQRICAKKNATNPIKCSAVSTMERDMPDFDYYNLVHELRDMVLEDSRQNPGHYATSDLETCSKDDWFIQRYLLRAKLDLKVAFQLISSSLRYKHESLLTSLKITEFPAEFFLTGGMFTYERDRKGNVMLYVRGKVNRRIPEVREVLQTFIYMNLMNADIEAQGKGIAIIIDCSGAGLSNVDIETLMYFVSLLKNYYPKGLSYILVHHMPFLFRPIWHLVKQWLSADHRELVKFSDSKTIFEFVDSENLPDFMGGTCKRSYTTPPKNCNDLRQAAKLWGFENSTVDSILAKFIDYLPEDYVLDLNNKSLSTTNDSIEDTEEDTQSNASKQSVA